MWEDGPLREIYIGPPISRKQRAPAYFMLNEDDKIHQAALTQAALTDLIRAAVALNLRGKNKP